MVFNYINQNTFRIGYQDFLFYRWFFKGFVPFWQKTRYPLAKRVPGPHRCPFPRGRPSKRCPFYPVLKHPKGFIWAMFRTPSKRYSRPYVIYPNSRAGKRFSPMGHIWCLSWQRTWKRNWSPLEDAYHLGKRAVIETIFDQLKNICQIEHSRHRSIPNYLNNVSVDLMTYDLKDRKPSL